MLEEKAIEKLDTPTRQRLITALQAMDDTVLHRNREQFSKLLKKTLNAHDVSPSTPELKAILNALSERDPEADICMVKGQPEADAGLRDNENVPLGESVYDYFEREVKAITWKPGIAALASWGICAPSKRPSKRSLHHDEQLATELAEQLHHSGVGALYRHAALLLPGNAGSRKDAHGC